MATLTTGTVNFGAGVFMNDRQLVETFAQRLRENGIVPEIEIFDMGMLDEAMRLRSMGLITDPLQFDFVMGVAGGIGADPSHLLHMVRSLPAGSTWSVAGMGRHQLTLGVVALALGGHVRVGFEDNIYYRKGQLARSNAELVARIARIAHEMERPAATPAQAREILQLNRYKALRVLWHITGETRRWPTLQCWPSSCFPGYMLILCTAGWVGFADTVELADLVDTAGSSSYGAD
jgi:3-keto-5-aminohexanoate cleavage enzyme